MVELADTEDLSPFAKALAGSSPAAGTIKCGIFNQIEAVKLDFSGFCV